MVQIPRLSQISELIVNHTMMDQDVWNLGRESQKLRSLQTWLQNFIRDEGIVIGNENESRSSDSGNSHVSHSVQKIHVVPDRLKKPRKREEDCFTPQAFPIGLHNVVSCFHPPQLEFKFNIARTFIEYAIPDSPNCPESDKNSEGWKSLVRKIVGDPAAAQKLVKDVYKDFRAWELRVEHNSSGRESQTIRHWHFALLLAVDAVFVVTSVQASIRGQKNYSETINGLIRDRKFEIAEFLTWDLSLVENQVPLNLLWKVINLQVNSKTKPELEGQKKSVEQEFDQLIKQAVRQSYPFLRSDSERDDCWKDFTGCCCPCGCHGFLSDSEDDDSDPDLEAGSSSSIPRNVDYSSRKDVDYFDKDWEITYKNKFTHDKYFHLLHCIHAVSSWLEPATAPNPSTSPDLVGTSGQHQRPSFGSLTSQTSRSSWRILRSSRLPSLKRNNGCTGQQESKSSYRNTKLINDCNEDWIPSATELRDAGVRIRGVATCLASPSFKTVNFWTVLTSLCCFVTFLACCFESCFCSSKMRWQASLELPRVKMYTETKRLLRNLAVYEELTHGERKSHLRNYIKTMRCLVPREEDVSLLIGSRVIQSHLAGPQDVVQAWKHIDDGLGAVPMGGRWVKIYSDLHTHLKNRWKNWYASFWISNCSNPLVACSFVIFVVLLFLSAFGTYLNVAKSAMDGSLPWP